MTNTARSESLLAIVEEWPWNQEGLRLNQAFTTFLSQSAFLSPLCGKTNSYDWSTVPIGFRAVGNSYQKAEMVSVSRELLSAVYWSNQNGWSDITWLQIISDRKASCAWLKHSSCRNDLDLETFKDQREVTRTKLRRNGGETMDANTVASGEKEKPESFQSDCIGNHFTWQILVYHLLLWSDIAVWVSP